MTFCKWRKIALHYLINCPVRKRWPWSTTDCNNLEHYQNVYVDLTKLRSCFEKKTSQKSYIIIQTLSEDPEGMVH